MFESYPDVMSVSQLRSALSIGRESAYSMVHGGVLKYIKIKGQYRILKQSLLDYIDKQVYNTRESDAGCTERSM